MSFFTTRERAEFGNEKRAELGNEIRMDRKVRDVVRSEFAPRQHRPDSDLPGHVDSVMRQWPADNNLGGHVGSVIQQVTESSLQEIDDLLVVLRRRREELLSESAHVQRAVIEYAKLSQSTMQSVRLITESLSHLNRVSAPRTTARVTSETFPRSTATAEAQPWRNTIWVVKREKPHSPPGQT
jgi:hypothetical protein